ncbi:hypothetical protein CFI10_11565 [Marinobacterium iners]|uniref:hypothetical protein n=1 Tax=Marinobacterium iners TaxID=48076 RepID=UPI001A8ECD5B|nr:hypothetical protein [Marinobacterium iners]QSR35627.1 hypothetical protein CFI10_11565 [Marinobacterium iners]
MNEEFLGQILLNIGTFVCWVSIWVALIAIIFSVVYFFFEQRSLKAQAIAIEEEAGSEYDLIQALSQTTKKEA